MSSPSKNHVSPLHNFSLPSLWTTDGASSLHRRRQLSKSPARAAAQPATSSVTPPPARRQLPDWGKQPLFLGDSPSWKRTDSSEDVSLVEVAAGLCGSPVEEFSLKVEQALMRDEEMEKVPPPPPFGASVGGIKIGEKRAEPASSGKLKIKLPLMKQARTEDKGKGKAPVVEQKKVVLGVEEQLAAVALGEVMGVAAAEEEADIVKSAWNLRPRNKGKGKAKSGVEASDKGKAVAVVEKKGGGSGGNGGEKKDKAKLNVNVSLTRQEIEEDLFAFGMKPSRRPRKRTKQVQTQLERLYPGNGLVNISADSYYVSLNSLKKKQQG